MDEIETIIKSDKRADIKIKLIKDLVVEACKAETKKVIHKLLHK